MFQHKKIFDYQPHPLYSTAEYPLNKTNFQINTSHYYNAHKDSVHMQMNVASNHNNTPILQAAGENQTHINVVVVKKKINKKFTAIFNLHCRHCGTTWAQWTYPLAIRQIKVPFNYLTTDGRTIFFTTWCRSLCEMRAATMPPVHWLPSTKEKKQKKKNKQTNSVRVFAQHIETCSRCPQIYHFLKENEATTTKKRTKSTISHRCPLMFLTLSRYMSGRYIHIQQCLSLTLTQSVCSLSTFIFQQHLVESLRVHRFNQQFYSINEKIK